MIFDAIHEFTCHAIVFVLRFRHLHDAMFIHYQQ